MAVSQRPLLASGTGLTLMSADPPRSQPCRLLQPSHRCYSIGSGCESNKLQISGNNCFLRLTTFSSL